MITATQTPNHRSTGSRLNRINPGLLSRAKDGNDKALEELIELTEAAIYALCRAILKDPQCAEDATQETFVRLVQNLPRFDHSRIGFEAWLLRIARNTAITMWRHNRKCTDESFAQTSEDDTPPARGHLDESPLDRAIAVEDRERILALIEDLPAQQREILILRFYHSLEPAEIAGVTGITPGNARIRLKRALDAIRRRLNEETGGSQP
jgi:RNA polymerase sigma-70 factor (ECF subfamily)